MQQKCRGVAQALAGSGQHASSTSASLQSAQFTSPRTSTLAWRQPAVQPASQQNVESFLYLPTAFSLHVQPVAHLVNY
jgi:hypothetical protein